MVCPILTTDVSHSDSVRLGGQVGIDPQALLITQMNAVSHLDVRNNLPRLNGSGGSWLD